MKTLKMLHVLGGSSEAGNNMFFGVHRSILQRATPLYWKSSKAGVNVVNKLVACLLIPDAIPPDWIVWIAYGIMGVLWE